MAILHGKKPRYVRIVNEYVKKGNYGKKEEKSKWPRSIFYGWSNFFSSRVRHGERNYYKYHIRGPADDVTAKRVDMYNEELDRIQLHHISKKIKWLFAITAIQRWYKSVYYRPGRKRYLQLEDDFNEIAAGVDAKRAKMI